MSVRVVGRAAELDALRGFLDRARVGPALLRIDGAAGIGKTALWRAGLACAEEFAVLACAPTEAETALPHSGLVDLFDGVDETVMSALAPPRRHALEVALRRAALGAEGVEDLAVALGVLDVVQGLAQGGPVLVAIDDVQWLDSASARAVGFAVRRLATEPVGVLVTVRAGEAVAVELGRPLTAPRASGLVLAPLDLDGLDELVRLHLGQQLDLPALIELQRLSGGNPLHALEVARAAAREQVRLHPGAHLPLPEDLDALLRGRLAELPAATQDSLVTLAELARPTVELLGAAVGKARAQRHLREAVEAGVVVRAGRRLMFTHPLLAAVLRGELDVAARRSLHARLAAVVDDPVEHARHLALASAEADAGVAARVADAAGMAERRGAPAEAALLAEQALRLTPAGEARALVERGTRAAAHHGQAGSFDRAAQLLRELAGRLEPGPVRVPLLLALAYGLDVQEGPTAAQQLYRQAIAEAADDPEAAGLARQALAWTLAATGRAVEAGEHARVCAALAEQITDPRVAASCLVVAAMVSFMLGEGSPPGAFERALALDPEPSMHGVVPVANVANPTWMSATHAVWSDDFTRADTQLEALRDWAEQRADEPSLSHCDLLLALADLRQGRFGQALERARAQVRYAERVHDAGNIPALLWVVALVEAHLGLVDDARAHAEEGVEAAQRTGHRFAEAQCKGVLGFLALCAGEAAEAWRRLAPLPERLTQLGYRDPGFQRLAADGIEAGVAAGALDDAGRLHERFAEQARRGGSAWGQAAARRGEGHLLAAAGDLDAGTAALAEAVGLHEPLGQPFELARTLLLAGAVARRAKRKAAARAALQRALATFQGLPAPLWAERARDELARLGGRPASPAELTATEREIAALVAAGRTNRQVADALFVSPKTVEWNLSKVYRKLGVRSRSELAATWPEQAGQSNRT